MKTIIVAIILFADCYGEELRGRSVKIDAEQIYQNRKIRENQLRMELEAIQSDCVTGPVRKEECVTEPVKKEECVTEPVKKEEAPNLFVKIMELKEGMYTVPNGYTIYEQKLTDKCLILFIRRE